MQNQAPTPSLSHTTAGKLALKGRLRHTSDVVLVESKDTCAPADIMPACTGVRGVGVATIC